MSNQRVLAWSLFGTLTLGLTTIPAMAPAQTPLPVSTEEAPAEPSQVLTLTLPECIQLAMERQPALSAYRSSLAAAQINRCALEKMRVPTFIARDLPIRRKQATLGVNVSAADLDQAERETVYAVTRTYFSVLYARAQKRVADSTVDRFKATLDAAQRQVQGGSRDVTTSSVNKITIYLRLAENRRAEAVRGAERALAALREAIGLEPGCCLQIPEGRLPESHVTICRDEIVALALARRGEIAQTSNAAEVTALEVDAQATSCRPTMKTFAAGADIHARAIPQGMSDGEYRPGAVGLEMPTLLAGSKACRKERARALSARASAVAEKTRNLVALEAEDAYLAWEEAFHKLPPTREAAEKANKLADDTQNDFTAGTRVKVEDVLSDEVLEAQAKSQYNEVLYRLTLALAALERVTAGGFIAGFCDVPAADASSNEHPVAPGQ